MTKIPSSRTALVAMVFAAPAAIEFDGEAFARFVTDGASQEAVYRLLVDPGRKSCTALLLNRSAPSGTARPC